MSKCKSISMLEDARDNALDAYNELAARKAPTENHIRLIKQYYAELDALEKAIKDPASFAMDILNHLRKNND